MELASNVVRSPVLEEGWLNETPPHYGAPSELLDGYRFHLGDRPVARKARELYELRGEKLPPELATLKGEVYLITHAFGLIAEAHGGAVEQLGFSATFDGAGSSIELFPTTRFETLVSADLRFEAGLSADGYLKAKIPEMDLGDAVSLGGGAEVRLTARPGFLGNLRLSVKTPVVQSIGTSASTATWNFHKREYPLIGEQVMVQTAVFPRGQKQVTFRLSARGVCDPGIFRRPFRFWSGDVTAVVHL